MAGGRGTTWCCAFSERIKEHVKYKYPPDKQPEAIRLVIEQMEAMAPRYSA